MQLTIDSREKLADVLRAVGGLYGIVLTVSDEEPARSPDADPARSGRRSPSRRARPRRRSDIARPDPKAVRAWALANGFAVSPRGSLPAEVRDAYAARTS